jgi:hypothetical protein
MTPEIARAVLRERGADAVMMSMTCLHGQAPECGRCGKVPAPFRRAFLQCACHVADAADRAQEWLDGDLAALSALARHVWRHTVPTKHLETPAPCLVPAPGPLQGEAA